MSRCQSCQSPLPASSPGDVCPACLMKEALGPMDSVDDLPDSLAGEVGAGNPATRRDPLEGTTLGPGGRYKILQRIGEGGFGTVFMAEQTAPVRRRVAIKVLKAGMDTRQVVARFEAERQALAMMDHPNIAKVLDGGETEHGRPFFVMELVRGTPITDFCDREQLDTTARLNLFLEVCRAVQHAHQKGIIHRDLKPGNILVTVEDGAEPVPKVIDFGVAKAMEANLTEKTLFTRFEQMIGTPAYMAPEQAGTDAAVSDIDTRADIYALGVLLYELLTGSTPFESATLQHAAFDEVRRILREEEAPRPSARLSSFEGERRQTVARFRSADSPENLDKQLRGDLDWIVMRAIEKDRRRRYETANALALDLERHLKDDPVEARPPSTAYRLKKFARRHKTALATAATILVILVAASVISTVSAIRASQANERSTESLNDLQTAYTDLEWARGEAERQRNQAIWNEYVARQFPLREAWEERNFGHLERLLEELVPAPGQPDFRGWEWYYYRDQCDQAFRTVPGRLPVWNPADGNLAVVRDRDEGGSAIVLVSPHDGSLVRTLVETPEGKGNRIYNLRWSGDGSRFAYLTLGGLAVVVDARTARPLFEHQIPTPEREFFDEPEVRGLDLSHDGSLLVTGTRAGNIQLWDVDVPGQVQLIQAADRNSHIEPGSLRIDPSSQFLLGALRGGRRTSWSLHSGEQFEYDRTSNQNGAVAWNKSGSRFVVTANGSFVLHALHQAQPLAVSPHHSIKQVSWIGDEFIISTGSDQSVRIWGSESHEEIATYQVVRTMDTIWEPTSDNSGRFLAVPAADKVKIIDRGNKGDPVAIMMPKSLPAIGNRHFISWDRSGRHILSSHIPDSGEPIKTQVRVWDLERKLVACNVEMGILRGISWNEDENAIHAILHGGHLLHYDFGTSRLKELGSYPDQEGFQSGFSPDGRWLIVPQSQIMACVDLQSGKTVSSTDSRFKTPVWVTRWSGIGNNVAFGYWSDLQIWRPFDSPEMTTTKFRTRIKALVWSPDFSLIAVGDHDGRSHVLDAGNLEVVAILAGHTGEVSDLDWSANGRLASASEDGTVRIWDDATGDELLVFEHPEGRRFLSVRWTHDGRRLAAGDEEGRIFIWGSETIQARPAGACGLESGIFARPR